MKWGPHSRYHLLGVSTQSGLWIGSVNGWSQKLHSQHLTAVEWQNTLLSELRVFIVKLANHGGGTGNDCVFAHTVARKWKSKGGVFLISSLWLLTSPLALCIVTKLEMTVTQHDMQRLITVLMFHFLARLLQRPWQNPCWQKYLLSWWTSSTPWSWSHQTPTVLHQTLRVQSDQGKEPTAAG